MPLVYALIALHLRNPRNHPGGGDYRHCYLEIIQSKAQVEAMCFMCMLMQLDKEAYHFRCW
jgi:hypothetical protein